MLIVYLVNHCYVYYHCYISCNIYYIIILLRPEKDSFENKPIIHTDFQFTVEMRTRIASNRSCQRLIMSNVRQKKESQMLVSCWLGILIYCSSLSEAVCYRAQGDNCTNTLQRAVSCVFLGA